MKESEIERRLCERIRKAGGKCLKFVSPGCVGVPDRIVLLPKGRVYFVELKTERGRLSPIQRSVQRGLASLGADVRTLYGMEQVNVFVEEVTGGGVQTAPIPGVLH